jgi:hypothetical protein
MYLLDTDHLSILDQDTIGGFTRGRRLAALSEAEATVTIITLANDATLLTRNVSDFGKVPGLKVEDWSV